MNECIFKGHIVSDIRANRLNDGKNTLALSFQLAVFNHKEEDGSYIYDYPLIKAYGSHAEFINKNFKKGHHIIVKTCYRKRKIEYQGKQGWEHYFNVNDVEFGGYSKEQVMGKDQTINANDENISEESSITTPDIPA